MGDVTPFMNFWRQMDIISPQELAKAEITLIGFGGINSFSGFGLTKMGVPKIKVYDPDKVEAHNAPNQLFRPEIDIGKTKVEAGAEICRDFSGAVLDCHPENFENQNLSGVVVVGVDSIDTRRKIWQRAKYNPAVKLYIDGRIGGEFLRVYALNPCNADLVNWYETTLHSSGESAELPCTERSVIYVGLIIASLIAMHVRDFCKGKEIDRDIIFDAKSINMIKSKKTFLPG